MHVLTWNFMILRLCGLWRPREWSCGWKKNLYTTYTILSIFLIYTFAMTELIDFAMSLDNLEDAANNCVMLLTILGVCYKMTNMICKREEIAKLLDILEADICRPRGAEEIAIQMRFDEKGRNNTLMFGGLSEMAVIAITVGSFLGNVPHRTLPFKAWLPFDYSSNSCFWIAFLHQIMAHAVAATIGSFYDTLFHGLMAQCCAQLNILKSRFRSLPSTINEKKTEASAELIERDELGKCVRHHQEIFRFVERTNDIFNIVIFVQFSVSTFVICMSTYTLSRMSFLSAEFTFVVVYLACMIAQIFLMCWYGNEVIVESMDVGTSVYEMNWDTLRHSTKKDLGMIMARTLEPISYTSGHVITLSLDSFNSLMKLSYSVYNLLQQTSS